MKKLFFNLRLAKSRLSAYEEGDLKPENVAMIATRLRVRQKDVIEMNRRIGGDASLNASLRENGERGENGSTGSSTTAMIRNRCLSTTKKETIDIRRCGVRLMCSILANADSGGSATRR